MICPLCQFEQLTPMAQRVDVPAALRRWEEGLGITFPSTITRYYSRAAYRETQLHECGRCGFGCFDPAVPGSIAFYEAIEVDQYYHSEKWEFDQAMFDLAAIGARKILDIGCGSGVFLRRLRNANPSLNLTGFDVSPKQMRKIREQGFETPRVDFKKGNGAREAAFDAI